MELKWALIIRIWGILSGFLSSRFRNRLTVATCLNKSAPMILISAPVSITPFAGTPWTCTGTARNLLPLSFTLICPTSPSSSDEYKYCLGSSASSASSVIMASFCSERTDLVPAGLVGWKYLDSVFRALHCLAK